MTERRGATSQRSEWFATIREHWNHFLERDIAPEAPPIQVSEMKRAFAAGAISGLQLCLKASSEKKGDELKADIRAHMEGIKTLAKEAINER